MSLLLHPPAKINIGLHICGRRADGYHLLQTLMVPAPLHDDLTLTELPAGQAPKLVLTGIIPPGSPDPERNLVLKAYRALQTLVPSLPPVQIALHKRIPAGAGLGGGSSDAGYTLRGLVALFGLKVPMADLQRLAVGLGADVPFFVAAYDAGQPMLAEGIGEVLTPYDAPLPYDTIRLYLSDVHSETAAAYRALNLAACTGAEPHLSERLRRPIAEWPQVIHNDFEAGVFARHPEIAAAKAQALADGALYAAMSGSGSAVFGLF